MLSQVEHLNLVKLLGFLEEKNERILVTEYVTNGNLRQHLDGTVLRYIKPVLNGLCRSSFEDTCVSQELSGFISNLIFDRLITTCRNVLGLCSLGA